MLTLAWIIAIIGQLADWYTTKRGLIDSPELGFKEKFSWMRWIVKKSGSKLELIFLALKLLFLAVLYYLSLPWWAIMLFGIIGLAAAYHNRTLIKKARAN